MPFYKTKSLAVEFEFAVAGQMYKTVNGFASFPEGTPLQKHSIWNPDTFEVSALFEAWTQADFEEFFDVATDKEVKAIRAQNVKDAQVQARKDAEVAVKAAEEATKLRIADKQKQVAEHPNQDPA
ncbi:MAG TPA: hypothetical protein VN476_03960, partial [Pyrinomonadaceae bacterium]|nr:hypothetical protein [Pyrinomonadaceae bacterium]